MKQIQKMYSQAQVVQFTSMEETDKQTGRRADRRASPGPGWTCHQGGFSATAPGPAPPGWAQGQRAPASPHSAPGWPASLRPRFLWRQNEMKANSDSQGIGRI